MATAINIRYREGKLRIVDTVCRDRVANHDRTDRAGSLCRLQLALLNDQPAQALAILESDPSLAFERDEQGANLCHDAALGGSLGGLRELVRRGLDCDQVSALRRSPLCEAAYMRRPEVLDWLLAHGASVDIGPKQGDRPAFEAVRRGFFSGFVALVENGAAFDQGNPKDLGRAPLHWLARAGEIAAIRNLLARGANVDLTDRQGRTPLFHAAEYGQVEAARVLLAHGARLDPIDEFGQTVVQVANSSAPEVLRLLIEAGADLDHRAGHAPLITVAAATSGDLELLDKLVAQGRPIEPPDGQGRSALQAAIGFGKHPIVDWLLDHGADVNYRDERSGATVLATAVETGEPATVERLLSRGARIDAKTNGKESALFLAASRGHLDLVETLAAAGADIEAQNSLGMRPLMVAASTAVYWKKDTTATAVVEWLCSRGAELNAADRNGWTALHHAADSGHEQSARVLLAHGAALASRSAAGKRPLDLAVEKPVPDPYQDRRFIVPRTPREDPQVGVVKLLFCAEMAAGLHPSRRRSLIRRARLHRCPQVAEWMKAEQKTARKPHKKKTAKDNQWPG